MFTGRMTLSAFTECSVHFGDPSRDGQCLRPCPRGGVRRLARVRSVFLVCRVTCGRLRLPRSTMSLRAKTSPEVRGLAIPGSSPSNVRGPIDHRISLLNSMPTAAAMCRIWRFFPSRRTIRNQTPLSGGVDFQPSAGVAAKDRLPLSSVNLSGIPSATSTRAGAVRPLSKSIPSRRRTRASAEGRFATSTK